MTSAISEMRSASFAMRLSASSGFGTVAGTLGGLQRRDVSAERSKMSGTGQPSRPA